LISKLSEQVKAFSTRVGHDTEPAGEEVINVDPESGEITEPLK
jgi:hypothetical protein